MQIDKEKVQELQKVVDTLNEVAEERIRCSERNKQTLLALKEKGFDSIEEAEGGLVGLDAKIAKKEDSLDKDFSSFMKKFKGALNED